MKWKLSVKHYDPDYEIQLGDNEPYLVHLDRPLVADDDESFTEDDLARYEKLLESGIYQLVYMPDYEPVWLNDQPIPEQWIIRSQNPGADASVLVLRQNVDIKEDFEFEILPP
jgi:hypothetical protein